MSKIGIEFVSTDEAKPKTSPVLCVLNDGKFNWFEVLATKGGEFFRLDMYGGIGEHTTSVKAWAALPDYNEDIEKLYKGVVSD